MKKLPKLRTLALPFLTAGLMSAAPMVNAEMAVTPRKPALNVVKSAAGQGATSFDWLQVRDSSEDAPRPVLRRASLGNGSWICSPAGFGKKSRCFRR